MNTRLSWSLTLVALTLASCAPLPPQHAAPRQLMHEIVILIDEQVIYSPRVLVLAGQEASMTITGDPDHPAIDVTIGTDGKITATVVTASETVSSHFRAGDSAEVVSAQGETVRFRSKVTELR